MECDISSEWMRIREFDSSGGRMELNSIIILYTLPSTLFFILYALLITLHSVQTTLLFTLYTLLSSLSFTLYSLPPPLP